MTCVTKLLELKGAQKVLFSKDKTFCIEGGGTHKDFEYLITFTTRGSRCGYVAIPAGHRLHGKDGEDLLVHGGITFAEESRINEFINEISCDDWWLGFDAAHFNDSLDLISCLEYFSDLPFFAVQRFDLLRKAEVRTFLYMENQCKQLIEQLL